MRESVSVCRVQSYPEQLLRLRIKKEVYLHRRQPHLRKMSVLPANRLLYLVWELLCLLYLASLKRRSKRSSKYCSSHSYDLPAIQSDFGLTIFILCVRTEHRQHLLHVTCRLLSNKHLARPHLVCHLHHRVCLRDQHRYLQNQQRRTGHLKRLLRRLLHRLPTDEKRPLLDLRRQIEIKTGIGKETEAATTKEIKNERKEMRKEQEEKDQSVKEKNRIGIQIILLAAVRA